jgi:hypothetical protein
MSRVAKLSPVAVERIRARAAALRARHEVATMGPNDWIENELAIQSRTREAWLSDARKISAAQARGTVLTGTSPERQQLLLDFLDAHRSLLDAYAGIAESTVFELMRDKRDGRTRFRASMAVLRAYGHERWLEGGRSSGKSGGSPDDEPAPLTDSLERQIAQIDQGVFNQLAPDERTRLREISEEHRRLEERTRELAAEVQVIIRRAELSHIERSARKDE